MDERAARIGKNEALFREVNERVKNVNESFGELVDAQFVCECGDRECLDRITVPLDEYERVRADPTTFFVKPGHEIPDVEVVVDRREGYVIVRKHAGDPEALAAATHTRS